MAAILMMLAFVQGCVKKEVPLAVADYKELHRPQLHFSPKSQWMNDPNGLIFYAGEYHLFYQHYPKDAVWGPMHWGHAVSTDLIHWEHLPIALYPDTLGMIFSGSAVADKKNSSGLGSPTTPPLVAMFTYHNAEREKQGHLDYQTQGIAYSIDHGRTWSKYVGNPVIKNPGVKDFRDPKMFWHEPSGKWIVTLVAGDHAEFYGSNDLKRWTKLSEFGKTFGSHQGVWECPDLFPLTAKGESTQKWILIININPGGPNGGSGTQYFIGDFDGTTFTCETDASTISWLDYGPDNYAGITWADSPGDRTTLIGWMSNWAYAQVVPTHPWRSATTIPRDLGLERVNGKLVVTSAIVPELYQSASQEKVFEPFEVTDSVELSSGLIFDASTSVWNGSIEDKDWHITFSNAKGQRVILGYEQDKKRFFIDRRNSGDNSFSKEFGQVSYAERIATTRSIPFSMVMDVSSVEVFFDSGSTVMTALFFPDSPYNRIFIESTSGPVKVDSLVVQSLKSIWP